MLYMKLVCYLGWHSWGLLRASMKDCIRACSCKRPSTAVAYAQMRASKNTLSMWAVSCLLRAEHLYCRDLGGVGASVAPQIRQLHVSRAIQMLSTQAWAQTWGADRAWVGGTKNAKRMQAPRAIKVGSHSQA